jgi:hypothetical protein
LPDLGHRFERFAAERIRVGGDTAPAEDAETLGVGRGRYGSFGVGCGRGREEGEAQAENFGKIDALLLGAGTKKVVGERGKQAGTVAAGAVGVDSAAVGEALEGCKGNIYDFMAGGTAEARYEACTTSVVVGVAPIWVAIAAGWHAPLVHMCLLSR